MGLLIIGYQKKTLIKSSKKDFKDKNVILLIIILYDFLQKINNKINI